MASPTAPAKNVIPVKPGSTPNTAPAPGSGSGGLPAYGGGGTISTQGNPVGAVSTTPSINPSTTPSAVGTNTQAAPPLDPSIANEVIQMGGGPPAPVPAKSTLKQIKTAMEIKTLMVAYQDLMIPTKNLSDGDVKALRSLGSPKLNSFLTAYKKNYSQTGSPGFMGFGSTAGTSPTQAIQYSGGTATAAEQRRITGGVESIKELRDLATTAIAKKIPGMNPKALADPTNVMNLQVPQALLAKVNDMSTQLKAGMTFDNLWNLKDQNQKPIVSAPGLAVEQRVLKSALTAQTSTPSGPMTAEQAYQDFVTNQFPKNPQGMVTELQNAGVLTAPNPTAADAYAAYGKLLTTAVQTKQPLANVISQATAEGKPSPQEQVAGQSAQAAWVLGSEQSLGVPLDEATRNGIITRAQAGNWDQSQINQAVAGAFNYQPGMQLSGRAASIWAGLQTVQQEYLPGMQLSQSTLGNWLSSAMKGTSADTLLSAADAGGDSTGTSAAVAAFKQYAQQQAAGMYPTFAPQILQGVSTKTLIDPYAQLVATLLGYGNVNASGQASIAQTQDATASLGIDWSNPKWNRLLQGGTNPETGRPAPMSLDQARQTLINDPQYGWQNTSAAQDLAAHVGDQLLTTFGFYKPGNP